jgi:hypothetical protein
VRLPEVVLLLHRLLGRTFALINHRRLPQLMCRLAQRVSVSPAPGVTSPQALEASLVLSRSRAQP